MHILVVEDGWEYTELLAAFLKDAFVWQRAGTGAEALASLALGGVAAVFLHMRFDRVAAGDLLGDRGAIAARFGGDTTRALRFLEENQGTFVLSAIRAAGHAVPVLMSYGFDEEPRRWARLCAAMGPVDYVPDAAGPAEVARRLRALVG